MTTRTMQDTLLAIAADMAGVAVATLLGHSRKRGVAWVRQDAARLMVEHMGLSKSHAGRVLRRDHATVVHAVMVSRKRDATGEYAALLAAFKSATKDPVFRSTRSEQLFFATTRIKHLARPLTVCNCQAPNS